MKTIRISNRFCGPPDSGNGGYVSGRLAKNLSERCVQVRLMAPPPMDQVLQLAEEGSTIQLLNAGRPVALARPGTLSIEVPERCRFEEAQAAARNYTGFTYHPFPSCFVCGPERAEGDGLRIFPGALGRDEESAIVAAPWVPQADLSSNTETVDEEFIWAALDCTGAFALHFGPGKVLVLGQFTVDVKKPVKVGEDCVVMGWKQGENGRKQTAGTALFNSQGDVCGIGEAIWIELKG